MTWDAFIKREGELGFRRTLMVIVVMWMTWESYQWAAAFAYVVVVKADNNLMIAAAALVGAVIAPVSWLTQKVVGMYFDSKATPDGAGK
jgi:hypothetical protein